MEFKTSTGRQFDELKEFQRQAEACRSKYVVVRSGKQGIKVAQNTYKIVIQKVTSQVSGISEKLLPVAAIFIFFLSIFSDNIEFKVSFVEESIL